MRQSSWGQTVLRANTCDLFEAPATPEAKPSKSKAAQCDGSPGPSPGSSDESQEDEEAEAKKKAAKAKTKEQKKHRAKYMRFYRSLDSQSLNCVQRSAS